MASEVLVQLKNLVKKYRSVTAINDFSLDIYQGEILGIWGPNGAGKSTLISMIATVSQPTAGEIIIKGHSLTQSKALLKQMIGFVPQEIALYPQLSGWENLDFWGKLYGLKGALLTARIAEVSNIVGLQELLKQPVATYSGGMQRRLNLAVALLHQPELLIMDEPTEGIDYQTRRDLIETLKSLAATGSTIIYISHEPSELEQLCDRIAVLANGKLAQIIEKAAIPAFLTKI